ncbi:MAG: NAD(P)H-dependent oxidoreductase [Prevotella sp.]|nr:NAD(P)H-dependent oxidoreductase [Prevotella sp.]
MKKKVLIAYYSRRGENYVNGNIVNLKLGNTEVVAGKIKTQIPDADVFQIDTTYEYSKSYMTCIEEAKQELHDQVRPEVKNPLESIADYDTIILGYPNWWGTMPMVVYTFLESYDFTGKTIIPFCTNEGSGMGSSVRFIKKLCPGAIVDGGISIHGAEAARADSEVKEIVERALAD